MLWRTISQISAAFYQLGMLCIVVLQIKWDFYIGHDVMRNNSGRERKDENLLSFLMSEKYNDREINEWYNKRNQGDKLEFVGDIYDAK